MAAGQSKGLCASAPDAGASLPSAICDSETGLRQAQPLLRMSGEDVSRRAVLGGAVALPFLPLDAGGGASFETGPRQARSLLRMSGESPCWETLLSAYRAAEAAVEEAGRRCSAASRAEIGAAEDAFGDRLEALYGALRAMLVVPAPDIGAFCTKVDLMIEHEVATLAGSSASLEAVGREARRFGEAAARG